jgi:hypothetical protein
MDEEWVATKEMMKVVHWAVLKAFPKAAMMALL